MALSMFTFNIGGDGKRAEKKAMISTFLSDQRTLPSLLLLQENPWRSDHIKKHIETIKTNYEAVSHKHMDAIILYRKDVLRELEDDSVSLQGVILKAFINIIESRVNVAGTSSSTFTPQPPPPVRLSLNFPTFMKRASFAKLTYTANWATKRSFVLISWHGEHTGLDDEKKLEKVKDLFKVIKEIHAQTKLPVILGGDFNIALNKVTESIVGEGFEYYDYTPANRTTIIDFFVVSSDVTLSEVLALGNYMYVATAPLPFATWRGPGLPSTPYNPLPLWVKVFDHDPVQAMITFNIEEDSEDNDVYHQGWI